MKTTTKTPVAPPESYQGTMTRRIIDMTPEERAAYYKASIPVIRERLFSIGQPLVYRKDDKIIVEHADGRIEYIS